MKKTVKRIFKGLSIALLICIVGLLGWRLLYGRRMPWQAASTVAAVDAPYSQALTHEDIAVHYAPQIDAAVNVLLSAGGRGDFLTAVNYDGNWRSLDNWDNLTIGDLGAVVYYSVQETDSHYYVGYYFYHPRDDAEIWLDRHENDMEGIMLAVPKSAEGFLPPEMMYTQGHGSLFFYFAENADASRMTEGSRFGGDMALVGDRPHIYICPNGTLKNQGHSVESAANHSTYWSVGNSGIRYVCGGLPEPLGVGADGAVNFCNFMRAEHTPTSWNGPFEDNLCSYELRPLDEIWLWRNGPYDGTGVFGSYGAFDGDNWGEDKANPPWAWRNKTIYGFGGSFLSDPVWTFNRAVADSGLSADYTANAYADWRLVFGAASIPASVDPADCTLHLMRDGWEFSNPAWFTLTKGENGFYTFALADGLTTLWAASPAGGSWRMEVRDAQGKVIPGAAAAVTAEHLGN